jgi:hypothetical protein
MAANWFQKYPLSVLSEIIKILPDSIVVMSGLMSLLTTSYSQFVFFISLLESIGGFYLFRGLVAQFEFGFVKPLAGFSTGDCKTGFSSPTLSTLSFFTADSRTAFPSAPLYMISVAAAYVFTSLSNQMKELEALGPDYSPRFYISIMALCALLFFVGSYRMMYSCESMIVVMTSIALGLFVGTTLVAQNLTILGPDSTNLSGIPLLRNRTATGEKIYICAERSS